MDGQVEVVHKVVHKGRKFLVNFPKKVYAIYKMPQTGRQAEQNREVVYESGK